MTSMIIVCLIAGVAFIVGYLSSYFLGNNNPVEQECEKIIKDETGAVVSFGSSSSTPNTPTTTQTPKSS